MTFALVAAAGRGLRFGGETKKQFLPLLGKPVFIHTLGVFQAATDIDQIICVVPEEDLSETQETIKQHVLSKVVSILPGGRHRQDSVVAAIAYLEQKGEAEDIVLVHDGVRPLIRPQLISKIVAGVKHYGAVVAALPVTDSLKEVSEKGIIQRSLPRDRVWAMQTPQGFRLSILAAAYREGATEGIFATDEAMLVERLGQAIHCIEGEAENIKITSASDFSLAELFLQRRKETEIANRGVSANVETRKTGGQTKT